MEIKFLHTALDLLEGFIAGGLTGLGTYIIGGAVSSLPGSFLSSSIVSPLSIIAGALGFVGFAIPNIRKRISSEDERISNPPAVEVKIVKESDESKENQPKENK